MAVVVAVLLIATAASSSMWAVVLGVVAFVVVVAIIITIVKGLRAGDMWLREAQPQVGTNISKLHENYIALL